MTTDPPINRPIRLVFLFADVGGGHRAPAEAVREALRRTVGDCAQVELVDALADYAPFPYNRGRQTYTQSARYLPHLLGLFFHALDGPTRIRLGASVMWRPMRRAVREMLADHPADLYVSFHPTYSYPLTWLRVPSVFVFTDLVTNHALWCARGAKRYLVPTEAARERALRSHLPPDWVEVTGLPVHPRFLDPIDPPHVLRQRLALPPDKPVILLTGGGEGMGRVYDIAHAIGESGLEAELVIVTGRNSSLREELEATAWPMPTRVLGFTRDMPDWMAAATVLITKSGSNTIAEALVRGLPLVLFGCVPGQEEGNPQLIESAGAGRYRSRPAQVVNTLRAWLNDPGQLEQIAVNARALSRPNAAFRVARAVYRSAEERVRDLSR
ncbi:MAG TPA: glycosyltransferase [Anaerolineae bacterium]|nr:glycosyltransferase [Anaerolineae bacterium]